MGRDLLPGTSILEPGFVFVPAKSTRLCTVASFGVAVTMYDPDRKMGGMCHYLHPRRSPGRPSTAVFAGPAVVALYRMFESMGTEPGALRVHMFGGAAGPEENERLRRISEANVRAGRELLEKLGVRLSGCDIGGDQGRKIMFDTATGETAVVRVNRLRASDWDPSPMPGE